MLYDKAIIEKEKLEQQITKIQEQLKQLPEGQLFYSCSGKYVKWFWYNKKKQSYIPKKQRKLAEKLAMKKYLNIQLKNLLREKQAIDLYLQNHDETAEEKELAVLNSVAYKELLSHFFETKSQELAEWARAPYQKCDRFPENLKHKAISGNYVRSKSEEMIDMILFKNKIPFRYECALCLGEVVVYPDFTIRHPKTGEIYYWEHFGLMDDVSYNKNVFTKLQQYTSYGIIPTIQLITTYETKNHPLNLETIEEIVTKYFL